MTGLLLLAQLVRIIGDPTICNDDKVKWPQPTEVVDHWRVEERLSGQVITIILPDTRFFDGSSYQLSQNVASCCESTLYAQSCRACDREVCVTPVYPDQTEGAAMCMNWIGGGTIEWPPYDAGCQPLSSGCCAEFDPENEVWCEEVVWYNNCCTPRTCCVGPAGLYETWAGCAPEEP